MRPWAIGVVLLCAVALGACGGKGSGGASTASPATTASTAAAVPATPRSPEERRVRAAVTELVLSKSPSICTRLMTLAFVEQNEVEPGLEAVHDCRMPPYHPGATSVSIDRVGVTGTTAEADIRPRGGELPFKTATLRLRKAGGHWKADRLVRATLDRPAFEGLMRRDLAEPPSSIPPPAVDCVVHDLASVGDKALVGVYVLPDARPILIPIAVCTIGQELAARSAPKSVIACIVQGIRRELTTGATGRKLASNPADATPFKSPGFDAASRRIALGCVHGPPTGTIS